ncbi:hypothetical protein CH253_17720 [Rhodococcus sp. 06-156-3C]|uniref:hypothetical protein n=1 Tax=Nocardiaceae TaxID=85025 RepID=UPI0005230CBC|nr:MULTISPECIES: hypothetical protein [Rhodococcus]OZD18303.1 hypothetical protein CH280_07045 [Rhodococcus sp. 06-156-4C]OZD18901.1 hypothetical protein CH253_17720 [Rhodococcus sp. 06-156-3C]OZD22411.1 hypothetical protein CH248_09305 [Rhodococcus sp. 06-156-4a]OZD33995.1 hypothetical protein CH247_07835 [Rhodococcus sp. 06-156-3b]OZD38732.1 hypothetical protein CH284_06255 [Rhodococcus sp. 06-156-3]
MSAGAAILDLLAVIDVGAGSTASVAGAGAAAGRTLVEHSSIASGSRPSTLLHIVRVVMFVGIAGAGVLVVVFAARTVAFAGVWEESITGRGPARKLFVAIAFLIVSSGFLTLADRAQGALS